MKKIIVIIALTVSNQFSFGQIVPSSCTAPDSIAEKYTDDADRLTVRNFHQSNLAYADSIKIPKGHPDTVSNALIAVYNATTLPARDTVVALYNIHTNPNPDLNLFSVSADSNLTWMQHFKNRKSPTTNSTIDSLTNLYRLNFKNYSTHFGLYPYHTVFFESDSNLNIQPLSDIYKTIYGVFNSEPEIWIGYRNEITSTIYSEHVELVYSVGWGDCMSGCMYRRYWKFNIYYDCSVEYVGSYGTSLPTTDPPPIGVASSCTAPDSIVEKYNADAARLTLRKIYQNNLTYIDSIKIPQDHADTILNALIAVYNAHSIPARDTIVSFYNIHTFPEPDINSFSVSADPTLTWMQKLKNGISPTGNSTIDSLTDLYSLNVENYSTHYGYHEYHTVYFKSVSNFNIQPLSDIYETISGVYFSEPEGWVGDGKNITSTIYSNHIELIYSVGWEDCPSGCLERRYWKFNVYNDCSVEYAGSYGTPLPITASSELFETSLTANSESDKTSILAITEPDETSLTVVFPNPFHNNFSIQGINEAYDFFIYNMSGQLIIQGKSHKGPVNNLHLLPSGQYLLQIKTDKQLTMHKLVKN